MASSKQDIFTPHLSSPDETSKNLVLEARSADEYETVQALLHEVKRFCAKHVDGAAIDQRGALGRELLDKVAECGWFGLTSPEAFGGAGLSMKAATRVVTELAGLNGSLGTCIGLHSGLAMYSLIHHAKPALQERYLPEIASGSRITAFAATEPSAGSDIAAIKTLLFEKDGKLFLRGSKCYVTNGGLCGIVSVVAASPGLGGARAGHTMVAVDPTWPGVSRQKEEHKLGLKGSSTLTIDFDDVEIPYDHILGEPAKGLELAHKALTWGRTFMAAGCLGPAKASLAHMIEHTNERQQFGRPLAQFPLVRHQLASAAAEVYAAESVLRTVCDLSDGGQDIALESTIAKIFLSETSWNVADRGIQLLGGAGFIEDTGMPRRLRDIRVTRIFEGANDVLRLHLAAATLGWKAADLLAFPALEPNVPELLKESALGFDQVASRLGQTLASIRKTYGFKLFDKQLLQSYMADAIVPTWAMMTVLLRIRGMLRKDDSPSLSRELATAKLACRHLERRARASLDAIDSGLDSTDGTLVEAVLT